jgi:hypothetical protein
MNALDEAIDQRHTLHREWLALYKNRPDDLTPEAHVAKLRDISEKMAPLTDRIASLQEQDEGQTAGIEYESGYGFKTTFTTATATVTGYDRQPGIVVLGQQMPTVADLLAQGQTTRTRSATSKRTPTPTRRPPWPRARPSRKRPLTPAKSMRRCARSPSPPK